MYQLTSAATALGSMEFFTSILRCSCLILSNTRESTMDERSHETDNKGEMHLCAARYDGPNQNLGSASGVARQK